MKKRLFAIPSLLVAGFHPPAMAQHMNGTEVATSREDGQQLEAAAELFRRDASFRFAGHSSHRSHISHRSHSSHSSHSSHRSSASGGGYYPTPAPPPVYRPSPTPTPRPRTSTPTPAPAPKWSPLTPVEPLYSPPRSSAEFPQAAAPEDGYVELLKRVQRGLAALGYYDGIPDGKLGPLTRGALRRIQADYGLEVTGTVTPGVLALLGISVPTN